MESLKQFINILKDRKETIATMESCTGGFIVNAITNIEGASEVLQFSAITYSNVYKIKFGVDSKLIDTYSVYSQEVANSMSKSIAMFASADYGIGITGKLNQMDPNNLSGDNNTVYISIYDRKKDRYYTKKITVFNQSREENKQFICNQVIELFKFIYMDNKS